MTDTTSQPIVTASQKRPLEEPSSPAGPGEQPDAKRPALDKVSRTDTSTAEESSEKPAEYAEKNGGEEFKAQGKNEGHGAAIPSVMDGKETSSGVLANAPNGSSITATQDETTWLHLRAIISSAEAATVIGKGGENVTLIRRMSGAKCTVSDYSRGAVERILTVSGAVDAAAKVSILICHLFSSALTIDRHLD